MSYRIRSGVRWVAPMVIGVCLLVLGVAVQPVAAITPIPDPTPEPGSYGLEATKTQPPPTQAATVTTPGSGSTFSTSPTTVNGICPDGLLVEIYDNGVMVGSTMCNGGSFSIQVSLFSGSNELSAIDYDSLGQAGPTSNTSTVTYTNAQFSAFGQLVTLTSSYGRRSAAAGNQLSWPLQLSGGTQPYAFSVDWGDNSTDLKSQSGSGVVTIGHTYKKAGIYEANIKATDANGVTAFLQLVAVANGQASGGGSGTSGNGSSSNSSNAKTVVTNVVWLPAAIAVVLLLPVFWLGRQSQLVSLHNKMLKERDGFAKDQKHTT